MWGIRRQRPILIRALIYLGLLLLIALQGPTWQEVATVAAIHFGTAGMSTVASRMTPVVESPAIPARWAASRRGIPGMLGHAP